MKKFNNLKMVLFDSTNSAIRVAVEASFVRGNQQQGFKDLVYITDQGNGALNPNIYLTFTYKGGDNKSVYTSYPQLYKIREAFTKIKDMVADGTAFLNAEGVITVRQEYASPIILSNIGKSNNWISLVPVVMETGENGVINHEPGVSIELSTSNGYASILSIDEFLTLYTIINDLDLASIQCQVSLAFLQAGSTLTSGYQMNPAPNAVGYGYGQQYGQVQQPQYQQPQYQYAPVPTSTTVPQFNGSIQSFQPRAQQVKRTVQTQTNPAYSASTSYSNVPTGTPTQQATQTETLQPRAQKPIMNPAAVEETPISEISYDDMDAIEDIFNN